MCIHDARYKLMRLRCRVNTCWVYLESILLLLHLVHLESWVNEGRPWGVHWFTLSRSTEWIVNFWWSCVIQSFWLDCFCSFDGVSVALPMLHELFWFTLNLLWRLDQNRLSIRWLLTCLFSLRFLDFFLLFRCFIILILLRFCTFFTNRLHDFILIRLCEFFLFLFNFFVKIYYVLCLHVCPHLLFSL